MNKRMTVNEHITLLQKAASEALDKDNYLLGYASTLCERLNEVCARLDRLETNVQTDDRWKLQQELAQMRKERDEARRERDHENAKYEEAAYKLKKLRKYGRHHPACSCLHGSPSRCDCGFGDALRSAL